MLTSARAKSNSDSTSSDSTGHHHCCLSKLWPSDAAIPLNTLMKWANQLLPFPVLADSCSPLLTTHYATQKHNSPSIMPHRNTTTHPSMPHRNTTAARFVLPDITPQKLEKMGQPSAALPSSCPAPPAPILCSTPLHMQRAYIHIKKNIYIYSVLNTFLYNKVMPYATVPAQLRLPLFFAQRPCICKGPIYI